MMFRSEEDASRVSAVVDMASEDIFCFADVHRQPIAEAAIRRLRCKLNFEAIVDRIRNSRWPDELLAFLDREFGGSTADRVTAALQLVENPDPFEPEAIYAFADLFWYDRMCEVLADDDHEQAWTLLKIAVLGTTIVDTTSCVDYVLSGCVEHEPVGLTVSNEGGKRLVRELHAAYQAAGLVEDLVEDEEREVQWGQDWPHGRSIAIALGTCTLNVHGHPEDITLNGFAAFAVGAAASTIRQNRERIDA